jgi:UDP-3-O-[3-hydroxymyristoyl] glucosamine N-acyltransferase
MTVSDRLRFIRKCKDKAWTEVHDTLDAKPFVTVGANCNIQEGVIVGLDGFGYEKNEAGEYEKFPHSGGVIIGNDVDILTGTCVMRGAVRDTSIGKGTKIASHCQIGHGSKIGRNCLLGAFTLVCGSVVLGDNIRTGQFVQISPHVKVGDNVDISSFTLVSKDVPPNSKVRGISGVIS